MIMGKYKLQTQSGPESLDFGLNPFKSDMCCSVFRARTTLMYINLFIV
jgi:hypothetical protein